MSQADTFRPDVRTTRNDALHRYEVHVGDTLAGFADYIALPGKVDFVHTEIYRDFSGMGLAKVLAHFAIDDVVAAGLRVIPHCEFMAGYLRKHHENDQFIDWP